MGEKCLQANSLMSKSYTLAMSLLNTNSPKPLNHPRRYGLFSPQHQPEIWPADAQRLRQLVLTSRYAQKLSRPLQPFRVFHRDRLGFLAQLLGRTDQAE